MTGSGDEQPTGTDSDAWTAADAEREAKAAEAEREAAKWRQMGTLVIAGPEVDPAKVLMYEALHAMVGLSLMRGTRAAEMAREVANLALLALGTPDDPSGATAVERMYRALHGAQKWGDRLVIYDLEQLVKPALSWRATGGDWRARAPVALRAKLVERWPDRTQNLLETDLAAWLDLRLATKIETVGVIARILHSMRWFGADPPETLEKVTKRVSEAQRARRTRSGEHVVKPRARKPKRRTIRRKSKAKRKLHA